MPGLNLSLSALALLSSGSRIPGSLLGAVQLILT